MPRDAGVYFWPCPGCAAVARPKPGDCCVFCSYGAAPCPPKPSGLMAFRPGFVTKSVTVHFVTHQQKSAASL